MDPSTAQPRVDEAARALGDPTPVDALPLTLTAAEWQTIARGLIQRVRALEAFLHDAHGPRHAERDGLITSSHYFEPGLPAPARRWLAVTGHDLARDTDGRWQVIEDNVRTPGLLFGVVAREVLAQAGAAPAAPQLEAGLGAALATALRDASPLADPHVVCLAEAESAQQDHFELGNLSRLSGVPVVTSADVRVRDGRLLHDGRQVDVVWHRLAEDRLRDERGAPTSFGAVVLEPLEAGTLTVVNAPGSGIADDKRTGAHVPELIRGLLGEEPVLAQPPTAEASLTDLEGLVVKSRVSAGGAGVELAPEIAPADPEQHVAQPRIEVAPEPVVTSEGLEPRAVDVRAHVLVGDAGAWVVPSTGRFSGATGEGRVNASLGGGVKALWVA